MNRVYAVVYIYWEDYDIKGLFTDYNSAKEEYDKLKDEEKEICIEELNTKNQIHILNSSNNNWHIYELPLNKSFMTHEEYIEELLERCINEEINLFITTDLCFEELSDKFIDKHELMEYLIKHWKDKDNEDVPSSCFDCPYLSKTEKCKINDCKPSYSEIPKQCPIVLLY